MKKKIKKVKSKKILILNLKMKKINQKKKMKKKYKNMLQINQMNKKR